MVLKEIVELEAQAVSKYLKHQLSLMNNCIMTGFAVICKEEINKQHMKGATNRGRESMSRRPKSYFVIGENCLTTNHFNRLLLLLSNEKVSATLSAHRCISWLTAFISSGSSEVSFWTSVC
jgi:hypothetical protein